MSEKTNNNVEVGRKANIFYDPSTGVKVVKGQIVTLTSSQLRSKKVRAALTAGHLVRSNKKATVKNTAGKAVEAAKVETTEGTELLIKLKALIEDGTDDTKIAKAFTLTELQTIATETELEDASDYTTKKTLLEAILENLESDDDSDEDEDEDDE